MNNCQLCEECKFVNFNLNSNIYYEIHITVKYNSNFIKFCEKNNIKVVHIEMGDNIPTHLMTSYSIQLNENMSKDIFKICNDLCDLIVSNSFNIERIKIETVPWNPIIKNDSYFETHFAVDNLFIEDTIYKEMNLHKSRNLLKKNNDLIQMLTYRKRCTYSEFICDVNSLKNRLISIGHNVNKVITEYALYDSNEQLDNKWLKLNI